MVKNRVSAVNIVTGYQMDDEGVRFRVPIGLRIFSLSQRADRICYPHIFLPNGYQRLSRWVKLTGREGDHSTSTNAEVKKT
jgi:hypothetical protein